MMSWFIREMVRELFLFSAAAGPAGSGEKAAAASEQTGNTMSLSQIRALDMPGRGGSGAPEIFWPPHGPKSISRDLPRKVLAFGNFSEMAPKCSLSVFYTQP